VARGAIRVSLGWSNTAADVEAFASAWRMIFACDAVRRAG
jgi:cysteine sulfinate desulfinase/cysteine desulfurase-like protein